jgi:hypothetical protein
MAMHHAYRLLVLAPSFHLLYLQFRAEEQCVLLWNSLLFAVAEHPEGLLSSLAPLIEAAFRGPLSDKLMPSLGQLDAVILNVVSEALHARVTDPRLAFVRGVLRVPRMLILF